MVIEHHLNVYFFSPRFLCCVASAIQPTPHADVMSRWSSFHCRPFVARDSDEESCNRGRRSRRAHWSAHHRRGSNAGPQLGRLLFGFRIRRQLERHDRAAAMLLNSGGFLGGEQPVPNGFRISRTSPIGGFEAGYNWQAGSNWLLGLETDFSLSDLSGQMGGSSNFGPGFTQSITAKQSTDWYGTVRASAGFLATPNLLLFGTGGFAYGRVANSASFLIVDPPRRLWRWRGCWGCIILVPEWCDVHCRKFVRGAHRLDRGRRGGMAA